MRRSPSSPSCWGRGGSEAAARRHPPRRDRCRRSSRAVRRSGRRLVRSDRGRPRRPRGWSRRRSGRLPHAPGVRVTDAIKRAGGATGEAAPDSINLAAPLADGQQIQVPAKVEGGAASVPGTTGTDGPISLGTATVEELDTIEGIGPVTAAAILEFRDQNGGVSSVDDLDQVSGIGPTTMEALRGAAPAVDGARVARLRLARRSAGWARGGAGTCGAAWARDAGGGWGSQGTRHAGGTWGSRCARGRAGACSPAASGGPDRCRGLRSLLVVAGLGGLAVGSARLAAIDGGALVAEPGAQRRAARDRRVGAARRRASSRASRSIRPRAASPSKPARRPHPSPRSGIPTT